MFDIDRWREIYSSIASNKLRTILSGFTISLALFVFIVLFGMGNGLQNGFQKEFFQAGAMNMYIYGTQTSESYAGYQKGRQIKLKNNDLDFLIENHSDKIKYISGEYNQMFLVKNKGESGNYSVKGVNDSYFGMLNIELEQGRYLTLDDLKNRNKTIVIGRMVVKDLMKEENVIGHYLQMGGSMYEIVGVFSSKNNDDREERNIYVPITTLQTIYGNDDLPSITLAPIDGLSTSELADFATAVKSDLKGRHKVSPTDQAGVRVWDSSEQMSNTNAFFFVLTLIVFVIGGGSLIAGIVSIGNIMVFSVKERTKEIGIRKALGATPYNIITLIMQESIMITLLFGVIGILAATLLVENINESLISYFIYDPGVSSESLILACIILFVAGFLAGFLPARYAAKIKPIDALRDE
ncbi:MAG: ABC transporter permease [Weeksellaceae bacterium]|jgi:putative ABC transport system permease protein|nr:ABC transporter permease [Weeksellaceae bacterium]